MEVSTVITGSSAIIAAVSSKSSNCIPISAVFMPEDSGIIYLQEQNHSWNRWFPLTFTLGPQDCIVAEVPLAQ